MPLIFKKNYQLAVHDGIAYIKSNLYDIPISPRSAVFFTLLNGQREVLDIQDILIQIGLCSPEYSPRFCDYVVNRFSTLITEDDPTGDNPNREYNLKDFTGIKYPEQEKISMTYPDAILWNISNNCDKACIYCYMDAAQKSLEDNALTFEEVINMLDEAAAMGVSHIIMTGGEPFIRKDLTKIIAYAHSLGMSINITTKFYLSERQLDELKGLNKLTLYFSYDCHIDDIASYLTGTKNHALKMQNVIKGLVVRNFNFVITPVVTGITFGHFYDFMKHLEDLGVKAVKLSRYIDTFGRNLAELQLSDEQWNEIIEYCRQTNPMDVTYNMYAECIIEEYGEDDDEMHGVCVNGRYSIPLTHDGKAILCEQVPEPLDYCFGDLRMQTLKEIWNSTERQDLIFPKREKYKETGCYDCREFDSCIKKRSCLKRSLKSSGTIYSPDVLIKETCKLYKAGVTS